MCCYPDPPKTFWDKLDSKENWRFLAILLSDALWIMLILSATSCTSKTAAVCAKDANKINPYQNNQHQEKPYIGGKVVNDKGEQITGANSYVLGSQSVASGDVKFDTNFNLQ